MVSLVDFFILWPILFCLVYIWYELKNSGDISEDFGVESCFDQNFEQIVNGNNSVIDIYYNLNSFIAENIDM